MSVINRFKSKDNTRISPENALVEMMVFKENEIDEASLCHWIGVVGGKNGLSTTDMFHLVPVILRILKSDISWAQNKDTITET